MCMLPNGKYAWLMHMKSEDDSVRSIGKYDGGDLYRFNTSKNWTSDSGTAALFHISGQRIAALDGVVGNLVGKAF